MKKLVLIPLVLLLCAWTHGTPTTNPSNGYVAEDNATFYILEDGTTFLVQES